MIIHRDDGRTSHGTIFLLQGRQNIYGRGDIALFVCLLFDLGLGVDVGHEAHLLTQPVRTLFLFKSIWTRHQGSQGCQKIRFIFLQIKLLSSCAKIDPNRQKLPKSVKIEKKTAKKPQYVKTPVFS